MSLLLVAVLTELSATLLVYQKQQLLGHALTSFMKHRMVVTQSDYGTNISDTQLWDEIQLEASIVKGSTMHFLYNVVISLWFLYFIVDVQY